MWYAYFASVFFFEYQGNEIAANQTKKKEHRLQNERFKNAADADDNFMCARDNLIPNHRNSRYFHFNPNRIDSHRIYIGYPIRPYPIQLQ